MKVDPNRVTCHRQSRHWSQSHLATVADLNIRTIQRIESTGACSNESARALAAVFECHVNDLTYPPQKAIKTQGAVRSLSKSGAVLISAAVLTGAVPLMANEGTEIRAKAVVIDTANNTVVFKDAEIQAPVHLRDAIAADQSWSKDDTQIVEGNASLTLDNGQRLMFDKGVVVKSRDNVFIKAEAVRTNTGGLMTSDQQRNR